MYRDLSKGSTLLVITDMPFLTNGKIIKGYEPVIRELDSLSKMFSKIICLGYGYKTLRAPVINPIYPNIRLIPMLACGGSGFLAKLKVIISYPIYLFYIFKYIRNASYVHSRAPSHPALLAMLLSNFDKKRIYWHKYGGNWMEPNPPSSYLIQKKILNSIKNHNVYGTINGKWENQKKHLISFENPCLTESEHKSANQTARKKEFHKPLTILYVGALSPFKGVVELATAVQKLSSEKFKELIIAGDGLMRKELEIIASEQSKVPIKVMGFLSRSQLEQFYISSHIIALPSKTEGFPKAISEGCSYGCIPLVTNVSAIGQYIQTGINGYLMENNKVETIINSLNEIADNENIKELSLKASYLSNLFTYEYFTKRLREEILTKT